MALKKEQNWLEVSNLPIPDLIPQANKTAVSNVHIVFRFPEGEERME